MRLCSLVPFGHELGTLLRDLVEKPAANGEAYDYTTLLRRGRCFLNTRTKLSAVCKLSMKGRNPLKAHMTDVGQAALKQVLAKHGRCLKSTRRLIRSREKPHLSAESRFAIVCRYRSDPRLRNKSASHNCRTVLERLQGRSVPEPLACQPQIYKIREPL